MPLLDHFRQPHSDDLPWDSFSTMWVATVTGYLNRVLPRPRYRAFANRFASSKVEVRVADRQNHGRPAAVIRFVSPRNKSDASSRGTFVSESESFLKEGLGLLVIDIVTEPVANLHDEFMEHLHWGPLLNEPIYSATFRITQDGDRKRFEVWPLVLQLGQPLPVMPLPLAGNLMIPLDLEATYTTAIEQSGA